MKLGLKRGNTIYAGIIRARLASNFSHSAILIGDTLYQSTFLGGGVHEKPATPDILSQYQLSTEFGDDALALKRFEERRGFKYDWFSFLAFLLPGTYRDAKRDYCFETSKYMIGGEVHGRERPETLLAFMLGIGA